jgi:hypothetical protein
MNLPGHSELDRASWWNIAKTFFEVASISRLAQSLSDSMLRAGRKVWSLKPSPESVLHCSKGNISAACKHRIVDHPTLVKKREPLAKNFGVSGMF